MSGLRERLIAAVREMYGVEPEYPWLSAPNYAVLRHHGNGKWFAAILDVPGRKLGLDREDVVDVVNVKCDPVWSGTLQLQPGILPAYHMNKEHWLSVMLDGTVEWDLILSLLEQSYQLTRPKKRRMRMEKKLLLTGFEPFGGEAINPSWEAVRQLPDRLGTWRIHKLQIPVVFGKAADAVWEAAETVKPDAILCIGQAGGRSGVTPEQVAINLRNGTDNAGAAYQDSPVVPDGPAAYFATLPVRAMAKAVADGGISASISYSAGTYVCNDTLYTLLHRCAQRDIQVGFVHIPYLPQQAKAEAPSMPLGDMVRALQEAILAIR